MDVPEEAYAIIRPPSLGDGGASRSRAYMEWFESVRGSRVAELAHFVGQQGIALNGTPDSLEALGAILVDEATEVGRSREDLRREAEYLRVALGVLDVGRLQTSVEPDARTESLAFDCGIYLGDVIVEAGGGRLAWGRERHRTVDQGYPVIVGFPERATFPALRVSRILACKAIGEGARKERGGLVQQFRLAMELLSGDPSDFDRFADSVLRPPRT